MDATDLENAAAFLEGVSVGHPEALLILGSGLGALVEAVEDPIQIPFRSIPGLPPAGVKGHAGKYVSGSLAGKPVLVQAGRFHYYEGHPSSVVTAPIRMASLLGAPHVILTNAVGGIHRRLHPGSIVILEDQVNLQWRSPLVGPPFGDEPRFPDMSEPFDRALAALAEATAHELRLPVFRGIYGGVAGPSFETPSEVRMLRSLGADVVGMSTVPEVITARARGMPVLGMSLVTNRAAGLAEGPLGHEEVLEAGEAAAGDLVRLILGILTRLPSPERAPD